MNLDTDRISLAHIHAYVDAQLSDGECQRLEDYFDVNPDKFEQLQQFLAINDHYQSLYEPVLKEPIPQSMLERLYGEKNDPFASGGGIRRLPKSLLSLLFDKPKELSRHFHSSPLLNRLLDNKWISKLGSALSLDAAGTQQSVFTKILATLRLTPQTAPAWVKQLSQRTSILLTKIGNSFSDVNLFAAASIVGLGIAIGSSLGDVSNTPAVASVQQGFAESQATQAHLFFRKEGRTVLEIEQDKQHQFLTWLSGRLGKEIRLIDFTEMGYSNAGMMLVPARDNFAMVTLYEDKQGQKLTLYVGLRDSESNNDEIRCSARENTKSLCSWGNSSLQFVVVSDLAVTETNQLAQWMKQNYAMAHLISSNEYFFSQTLGTIKE